jgi:putative heme iron utilization protein
MTHDTHREVRDLVGGRDRAVLASALPAEPRPWPYASLVLAAVDLDLSPILLLSDLAEHSRAIAADARISLLFDGTEGSAQPLAGPRVTVLGRAERCREERIAGRFLARHPSARAYAGFADFAFYRVVPQRAHLVAGFGRISWLDAADLLRPVPHGLAEAESAIVRHMNEDHADAVALYAEKLLGLAPGPWQMTGIDAEGLDLRCEARVARLAFDVGLRSVDEVRPLLVSLAARARGS